MKTSILLSCMAALTMATAAPAGTQAPQAPLPPAPAPSGDDWWFRAAPYGWLTAMEGDVGIGRLSAPVDISISDTLDSLDMAFMGVFEVGKGNLSVGLDVIYGKVSEDIDAGGRIFDSFRFEEKQWILTPFLACRVIQTEGYHMDVFAGARITILETELTGRRTGGGDLSASADTDWADPIIGIRGQADFADRWFFRYNGDVGGFGTNSDLTWQAFAGIGYKFTENVSGAFGYRGLGVDYSKGNFSYDVVSHGPVIGFEVRF